MLSGFKQYFDSLGCSSGGAGGTFLSPFSYRMQSLLHTRILFSFLFSFQTEDIFLPLYMYSAMYPNFLPVHCIFIENQPKNLWYPQLLYTVGDTHTRSSSRVYIRHVKIRVLIKKRKEERKDSSYFICNIQGFHRPST